MRSSKPAQKIMSCFVLLLITSVILCVHAETIELQIEEGTILGKTEQTEGLQKKYYAFLGLPYAEPPVRFELAVPKQPWSGVLNCTADRDECVQGEGGAPVTGSEDCLFLSVVSGNLQGKSAVMVWIHGGGFTVGNSKYLSNGPDYLVDDDVVVVSIQYRLGIFGFMSTGDLACPGNLGLKDQNLALRWIKRNIKYFGGDPDNVTIMGESAGSACVAMQVQSPTSQGLFHKAIMNSGVSIASWSLNRRATRVAFTVGATLGILTTSSTNLVRELKKIHYFRLQEVSSVISIMIASENVFLGIFYGPVKEIEHPTAFFTGRSEEVLSKGNFNKVPVLAGFTSNEASVLGTQPLLAPFRIYFAKYEINSLDLVPADLTTSVVNRFAAANEIKKEFFGNSLLISLLTPISSIVRFVNVEAMVRPINQLVRDIGKYVSDTYYYQFSYVGDFKENKTDGVPHAEDLDFIFRRYHSNYTEQDQLVRKRVVRMWSNFCKFSKPTPQPEPLLNNVSWLPASSKQPPFLMNIDSSLAPIPNPFQQNLDFYDRLYAKYGQGVYNTY